jgi:hypothetical protein
MLEQEMSGREAVGNQFLAEMTVRAVNDGIGMALYDMPVEFSEFSAENNLATGFAFQ